MGIAIIDHGSGNLRSAAKAFERAVKEAGLDLQVDITAEPEKITAASHVVLPGVGAFSDCMEGLAALSGMAEALDQAVIKNARPFLGICVGMQLMASQGLEHGGHRGLGWIPGKVVPLEPSDESLKVPHMGWNELELAAPGHPFFKGIPQGAHVYFVHSYGFQCADKAHLLAGVDYGGPAAAVVGRDNMLGTQFHPEKSQATGLKMIANFLKWRP